MCEILEQVREAIEQSGKTRYRISKDTGIGEPQLSKLMSGTAGLSFPKLELLMNYLGYKITLKRRRK
jgi:transcriptional regulator with XRE-family HTH domain